MSERTAAGRSTLGLSQVTTDLCTVGLYRHSSLMRTDCARFGLQQHPAGSLRLQNTDFYLKLKPQRESLLAARWLSSASHQPWHLSDKLLLRLPLRMWHNWEKKRKKKESVFIQSFLSLGFQGFSLAAQYGCFTNTARGRWRRGHHRAGGVWAT